METPLLFGFKGEELVQLSNICCGAACVLGVIIAGWMISKINDLALKCLHCLKGPQEGSLSRLRAWMQGAGRWVWLTCLCLMNVSCADLRHSLAWRCQTFARIPAPLPAWYSEDGQVEKSAGGWKFRHVVACMKNQEKVPEAHWWMVTPEDPSRLKLGGASPLKMLFTGTAIRMYNWERIEKVTPEIADASAQLFGVYPQVIEPDLIFKEARVEKEAAKVAALMKIQEAELKKNGKPAVLRLNELHEKGWSKGSTEKPPYDPLWHHADEYSQLEAAKKLVRARTGKAGGGIRIGLLDTGYNKNHVLVPENTLGRDGQPGGDRGGEVRGDAIATLYCGGGSCVGLRPGETLEYHGMKAMTVLGGGALPMHDTRSQGRSLVREDRLAPHRIEIGGAPDAVVVPARVAPWVFSHSTANVAYAIDYASRVQSCDVISMSHGGTPSPMWIDAVNAAYERGTAIFAATADYFNLPVFELGVVAPSATVYPAACRRVQSVAGLTGNGVPYGRCDFRHFPLHYLNPLHWFPMRGSFGADKAHRDWLHTSWEDMMKRTDSSQIWRGGLMRPQTISTWTPNVASAEVPKKGNGMATDLMNMNWGGTSAATPQAAAAAALWLAANRREIEKAGAWSDWRKAEAVYVAMLKSSGGMKPGDAGVPLAQRLPDKYCGAGSLKAVAMLKESFNGILKTNIGADAIRDRLPADMKVDHVLKFPDERMSRDFFDGERSGAAMLGWESQFVPPSQRQDMLVEEGDVMRPSADPQMAAEVRRAALKKIYFNQRLVQQWNVGRVPRTSGKGNELTVPSLKEVGQSLAAPKNWLLRYFYPDADEIDAEAEAWSQRAVRKGP